MRCAERRDERFGGRIHLARVIAFARKAGFGGCAHAAHRRADARPTRAPPSSACDAALEPLAALSRDAMRGAIASSTSFITTTPSMAAGSRSSHSTRAASRWRMPFDRRPLQRAQWRTHFQDAVTRGRGTSRAASAFSTDAASAPLPAPSSTICRAGRRREDRRELSRDRSAEQRRQLGTGDEVACRAELARARDVIAERRRIQHDLHVARERHESAGCARSRRGRARRRARCARTRVGSGRRKPRIGHVGCACATVRVQVPSVLDWPDFIERQGARLEGKIVLITGGAKRVGAAICRRLHAAGASTHAAFSRFGRRSAPAAGRAQSFARRIRSR